MELTELLHAGRCDEDEGLSVPRGSQELDEVLGRGCFQGALPGGRHLFQ